MSCEYIVVQAGGRGSRMGELTRNKPKALVPVENLPMIFHLFKKFPDKKFIIICDYKAEVLEKYLDIFAKVRYNIVKSSGFTGTCAGLKAALSFIPEGKRFMLIWCDLKLSNEIEIPEGEENIIGISDGFTCRWKYSNGIFSETPSSNHGVAGFFSFNNKASLSKVPDSGEFVRWLCNEGFLFKEFKLTDAHEYGTLDSIVKAAKHCRPFNKLSVENGKLFKTPTDELGYSLAEHEISWYKKAIECKIVNIPEIYSFSPLCMKYIEGKNVYEFRDSTEDEKSEILKKIICSLKIIHNTEHIQSEKESYYKAYIGKTFDRLDKVKELIPFSDKETIIINGKTCRNVFFLRDELQNKVMSFFPKKFTLIHGDCTFSNIIINREGDPVFIDPRGYFGDCRLFGDPSYDWVKLYYSLFSNYDRFNLKDFSLKINETDIEVSIQSNNWENLENLFFELIGNEVSKAHLTLLLSLVWLSLTTYAWEDYDSICAAFYIGLYYLEEALQ